MKTLVAIKKLKCGGCGNTIINKLSFLKDVGDVRVYVEDSAVSFNHTLKATFDSKKKSLAKLGYTLVDEKNSLGIKAKIVR